MKGTTLPNMKRGFWHKCHECPGLIELASEEERGAGHATENQERAGKRVETPCTQTPGHEIGKGKQRSERGDMRERRQRSEETGKSGA